MQCRRCKGEIGTKYMVVNKVHFCLRCCLPLLLKWVLKRRAARRKKLIEAVAAGAPGQTGRAERALDWAAGDCKALKKAQELIDKALQED